MFPSAEPTGSPGIDFELSGAASFLLASAVDQASLAIAFMPGPVGILALLVV